METMSPRTQRPHVLQHLTAIYSYYYLCLGSYRERLDLLWTQVLSQVGLQTVCSGRGNFDLHTWLLGF